MPVPGTVYVNADLTPDTFLVTATTRAGASIQLLFLG
jgi:hypothetical protein